MAGLQLLNLECESSAILSKFSRQPCIEVRQRRSALNNGVSAWGMERIPGPDFQAFTDQELVEFL